MDMRYKIICTIYLLVLHRIYPCICVQRTYVGIYKSNMYSQSVILKILKNIGPSMCIRRCQEISSCGGVNFIKVELRCDLLSVSSGGMMSDIEKSQYASLEYNIKNHSDCCSNNPCKRQIKCVKVQHEKCICIRFDEITAEVINTMYSPGYPNTYGHNMVEYYNFETDKDHLIGVRFNHFHLETYYDKLMIFDDSEDKPLATLTGNCTLPCNVKSIGNHIQMKFTTDSSVTKTGFAAEIYRLKIT